MKSLIKRCYKGIYACFNAGLSGAFLIPFFIVLIFCGVPLYFLEVSLGQFTGKSPVVVWSICPLFKGISFYSLSITAIHGPNLIKLSMSLEINGWLLLPSIQNKRCKLYHAVEVNELWLVSPFSDGW